MLLGNEDEAEVSLDLDLYTRVVTRVTGTHSSLWRTTQFRSGTDRMLRRKILTHLTT